MEDQTNRPHRKSKEKKKHDGETLTITLQEFNALQCADIIFYAGPNPKAFALANPGKGKRQAARSHEVRYSFSFALF
jgi:ribosome biogenesis protein BMS1